MKGRGILSTVYPLMSPAGSKPKNRQKALLNSMRHKIRIMNTRIFKRHFYGRKGLPKVGRKEVRVDRTSTMHYTYM